MVCDCRCPVYFRVLPTPSLCPTLIIERPFPSQVMLADLLFRTNDAASATYHFTLLLERRPNNYTALHRLILLLKRAGKLQVRGWGMGGKGREVQASRR